MAEELERVASDLNSLNNTLGMSAIEFKGFTKRLVEAADATTKSGKAWTTFSRFVSGSPIWKIQNKFRATLEVLAGFEKRSQENTKAQQEANKRVIEQVQSYGQLRDEIARLNELEGKSGLLRKMRAMKDEVFNKELTKAIENTNAYNRAILEGEKVSSARKRGIKELREKFDIQTKMYREAQKQARTAKLMKTDKGRIKLERQLRTDVFIEGQKANDALIKDITSTLKPITKTVKALSAPLETVKGVANFFKIKEGKKSRLMLKTQIAFLLLVKKVNPIFTILRRYLIFSLFIFTGALALAMIIKNTFGSFDAIFDTLMGFGTFAEQIGYFIGAITETVSSFFNMVGAFLSGDYSNALDYLGEMLFSLGEILWRGALIGLQLLVAFLVSIFFTGIALIWTFFTNKDLRDKIFKGIMYIGIVLVGLAITKYIVAQALMVAAIYALPILIGAAIVSLLTAGIMMVIGSVRKSILGFANGGVTKGGTVLVGERGPELVNLPKGSRVHSNAESKRMVGGNTINVTINANSLNDNELRRVAQKVGDMINRQVNRSTSSSTIR